MKVFARCYKNLPNQRSLEDAFPRIFSWILLTCISPIYRNWLLKKTVDDSEILPKTCYIMKPHWKKCGK